MTHGVGGRRHFGTTGTSVAQGDRTKGLRSATMTMGKIFTKWDQTHSELWSHQPIRLEHEMHKSPAFSIDDLAKLIEGYPREHYSLVQTGARGTKKLWREGDIGNLARRALAQHARRRRRRQPLSKTRRPDVRGNRRQGARLQHAEGPPGKPFD